MKSIAKAIPPIKRLLDQRDELARQRDNLQDETDRLRFERDRLLTENNRLISGRQLFMRTRDFVAEQFLTRGKGIEIGALHEPQRVPENVEVSYVDRMSVRDLRNHYPELADKDLVEADIIDNGETLASFKDASQDFVIANHLLEHCPDPIRALLNMLRVLKTGGILFLTVPDKRFTFDSEREVTQLSHLIKDHEEGPETSKSGHYDEWIKYVKKIEDKSEAAELKKELTAMDYGIHYHAWTIKEISELLISLRDKFGAGFIEEMILHNDLETVVVLRKA